MSTSQTPASTGPLTKKRLDLRKPGKNRPKRVIVRKPGIIGDDFWKIFAAAQEELAKALEPGKAGRPRRMQKNWGAS